MLAAKVAPERLVFLRTSAGPTLRWRRSTATRPGASERGFRCPEKAGQEHYAAFEHDPAGDGTIFGGGGGYNRRGVRGYVEKVLAPSLRPGQVVVMDNLGAHRPKKVRELIEERGCEL
jgi:hypothetical protein